MTGPTVRGGTPVFSKNKAPKAKYNPIAMAPTNVTKKKMGWLVSISNEPCRIPTSATAGCPATASAA